MLGLLQNSDKGDYKPPSRERFWWSGFDNTFVVEEEQTLQMATCVLGSIPFLQTPHGTASPLDCRSVLTSRRCSPIHLVTSPHSFPNPLCPKSVPAVTVQSSQCKTPTPGACILLPPHVRGENAGREFSFSSGNTRRCVTPGTRWRDSLLDPERGRGAQHGRHRMSDDAVLRGEGHERRSITCA